MAVDRSGADDGAAGGGGPAGVRCVPLVAQTRPGHLVQTLEPVELMEISPMKEHDRTMATIAKNLGLAVS